ncbi:MAG TPA: hypothetical protein VGJ18_01365 [Gemmatimonadaceae bacterium]
MTLSILAAGCTALTEPGAVKLFVMNTTCGSSGCRAYHVLAFPEDQPTTPGGFWSIDLGEVTTASACLTIPATATFKITDAGTGATKILTWTTRKKVSVGAVMLGQSAIQASPSTGTFIPAAQAGWSVALPGSATPTRDATCQ